MNSNLDYGNLAAIKSINQKDEERRKKIIDNDIESIDQAIISGDAEQMKLVHISIEGKYAAYIHNFGMSMYGYNEQFGFNYELIDEESLKHNLTLMKARIEGYSRDFPVMSIQSAPQNNISVSVPVTNEININITFEQAKQQIEDMPGLTDADTEEIKTKIDDLENISKEAIPKKKKWEKVKPILAFALDKGADVAIAIMSLILQMKLGM